MQIISHDELESTLSRPDNAVSLIRDIKERLSENKVTDTESNGAKRGRPVGAGQIPDIVRDAAALDARLSGNVAATAEVYGLGYSTVAQNSTGIVGGNKDAESSKALRDRLRKQMTPIRDRALDRLMKSMELMTDDKLEKSKPGELANVASQMSRVVEKSIVPEPEEKGADRVLVIPQINIQKESHYQTVVVES